MFRVKIFKSDNLIMQGFQNVRDMPTKFIHEHLLVIFTMYVRTLYQK